MAWASRMLRRALMVAALAAAIPAAAGAQTQADIEAANGRVEQLYAGGRYAEAAPVAEQTLAQAEQALGAEHRATLSSVANLALLYGALGRDGEAEAMYRRALEASERVLGQDDPDTLVNLNNWAVFYQGRGRNAEAEPLMRRALEASDRVLGPDHADSLQSAQDLAVIDRALGRRAEAEALFKRALSGRERVLGPDHPDTLASIGNLAMAYIADGRPDDAGPLLERFSASTERALGKDHPGTLTALANLAQFYGATGRPAEAEPILKRVWDTRDRVLGKTHADTLLTIDALSGIYIGQGRYAEAVPLVLRAMESRQQTLGAGDPATLKAANTLAELYRTLGRYSEAEPLYQRSLEARLRLGGKDHPDTLTSLGGLAQLYFAQGRDGEAEPLMKQALEGAERTLGREDRLTLIGVNNLAALYRSQGRYDEAEPLYRRAREAFERLGGPEDFATIRSINNLADLYTAQGRYGEAEPLLKRALEVNERTFGAAHRDTLVSLNNLAELYRIQARYGEAEPLLRRAFDTLTRDFGLDHRDSITSAGNLALLAMAQRRYGEAETLLRAGLDASARIPGGDPRLTSNLASQLAFVRLAQSDWAGAADLWRQGSASVIERVRRGLEDGARTGRKRSEAEEAADQFQGLVKALYRRSPKGADAARESFVAAQWALGSEAAQSLAQMAARGAKGDPALAGLVRERQDLIAEWQQRDGLRNAALGEAPEKRNAAAEAENLARLAAIDARIAAIDTQLAAKFPDYAALASPVPLPVEEVRAQLGADEALVLFLDGDDRFTPTPEETFIWVVTRTELRWVRADLGRAALIREVQSLRCGLDEEEWATPTQAARCADLLGLTSVPDPSQPLPFHLGKAHALFKALFGQVGDLIAGKRLLIVPSGALTLLPFQVLVSEKPAAALPKAFRDYRKAAWLGRRNAITTLPAVSSLKALRQNAGSRRAATGAEAYAGYGNPRLNGDGGLCRSTKSPAACPAFGIAARKAAAIPERATVRGSGGRRGAGATMDTVFAKGPTPDALIAQVRGLCPLPDTAYEIKCVAERFKGKAPLVRLEAEANEANVKALSASGELARYRILHFATHGLLSGDVERMARRHGEPALVLTPPDTPSGADDDGLLMASEVAGLRLNADWVVLSACNTAAGDQTGAQALSGLARAFFYAGGRALLVSHWPVYSDAAVQLTTRAFAELDRDPKAGRAEALQRAMIALMDDRSQPDNAHPAVWAPFVVAGEGGRAR
ncbi:CHAT domain-containing tetratricopeptide repeat protein [Rhodomicrobium vannielii]|nr:CHAT domain-containing protein [Rhodomicrobium vannielii]